MAQWVKDMVLSLLGLKEGVGGKFTPGPGIFSMAVGGQKKKKKKKNKLK